MGPGKRGNAEDVSKLKVAELKARLEELGESTKGKKAESPKLKVERVLSTNLNTLCTVEKKMWTVL